MPRLSAWLGAQLRRNLRSQKHDRRRKFRDLLTEQLDQRVCFAVEAISVALPELGSTTGASSSSALSMSADGRYVLFHSAAGNLVPSDGNGTQDVFVRDLVSNTTTLVSTTGSGSGDSYSSARSMSADGRYVLFHSHASNLVPDDANGTQDVFVRDLVSNTTTLVSTTGSGSGDRSSYALSMSADGRYVLFQSYAGDLVSGDGNDTQDVFVRDLVSNTTTLVSTTGSGSGDSNSSPLSMSADGRYVLFQSNASNLVPGDGNDTQDVFVRDLVSNTTSLVSTTGTGSGDNSSYALSMSADGRYVLFQSNASNLVPGDGNATQDVFVRDLVSNTTTLVSTTGSGSGNSYSSARSMSADGRYVLFESYASNLVTGDGSGTQDVFLRDLVSNTTTLVSTTGSGSGNNHSSAHSMSANGRYVLFHSSASNLVSSDSNGTQDVFVRDLVSNTTTLVSTTGSGSGNSSSFAHLMSAGGRYVLFESNASNLVSGDGNGNQDVFLRDLLSNTTTLVSTTGSGSGNSSSSPISMSADGRYVLFRSNASNLVAGDGNGTQDVFVRDLSSGITQVLSKSVPDMPHELGNASSQLQAASADGRYVLFQSAASNLVTGDGNGTNDVFVRDLVNNTTTLVSTTGSGSGNGASSARSISADGRYVLFQSNASNLVPNDNNGTGDVFVRDLVSNTTTLISTTGSGSGNGFSSAHSMSADGRYVLFQSSASNLVAGDGNGANDVFVRDLVSNTTALVSTTGSSSGNGFSSAHSMSADGRYVLFQSNASNLVTGDGNGTQDVFLRDLVSNRTTLVSTTGSGSGNSSSYARSMSADGRYVLFESNASNLVASDGNGTQDVFVRDLVSNRTTLVSTTGSSSGNSSSSAHSMSADGRYVLFQSYASNLVSGDGNGTADAFVRDLVSNITTLVSTTGSSSGDNSSSPVSMSADGRYVLFQSYAGDLVTGDSNGTQDVFVRDLVSNTTTLVSTTGSGSGNSSSFAVSMSADGRYVLFHSNAGNLVPSDGNGTQDVFVRDLASNITTLVSTTGSGSGNSYSYAHSMSADGRYVLFHSNASNLVAGDYGNYDDAFIFRMDSNSGPVVGAAISRVESEDAASFSVDLLQGASDPDSSDELNVANVSVSGDASGVSLVGNTLSINPAAYNYLAVGQIAVVVYSYDILDGNGGSVAQSATLTITGVNDGPAVAATVSHATSEDGASLSVNLLQGASDPDSSDELNVANASVSGDASGVSLSGNSLSINPAAYNYLAVGESAVVVYSYDIVDGNGGSVAQNATLTITGVNDGPAVSAAVSQLVSEDAASFTVDLLQGASDPDSSDALSVANVSASGDASGVSLVGSTLSINPAAYNYLAVGESAVVVYRYDIVDGNGGSVAQIATITITGVNDGPAVSAAVSQLVSEDAASFTVDLLQAASDPDSSDELNIANVSVSGDASGVSLAGNTLSINPAAYNYLAVGQIAVIVYGYDIVDGNGGSVAQSATITITGVNDGPAVAAAISQVENEDAGSSTVDLLQGASDPDSSDALSVANVSASGDAAGASLVGNTLSINPAAYNYLAVGEIAVVVYRYDIVDGNGGSVAQSATLIITGVNDGPAVAAAISQVVSEDAASFSVDLLQGASDPDSSDELNIANVSVSGDASGVSLSGNSLSINPAAYNYLAVGEIAVVVYSYDIVDGNGGSIAQSATLTITGVNDGPAVAAAISQVVSEDAASFSVDLLQGASDPDSSDELNIANVSASGDASGVSLLGNSLSINPAAYNYLAVGEIAVVVYSYDIVDGNGGSVAQSATITITGVNDGPAVLAAVSQVVSEDAASFSVDLLQGASDPDVSDELNVASVSVSGDASGVSLLGNTLSINPGAYNYLAVGQIAVVVYGYDIVDGNGGSVAQSATLTITGVNDGPAASGDAFTVAEDGTLSVTALAGLLVNDSDTDSSDLLRVVEVNGVLASIGTPVGLSYGTLTLQSDGSFVYVPSGVCDTAGKVETFSYTLSDGQGGTATATVTIAITPAVAAGGTSVVGGFLRIAGTDADDTIVLRNVGGVLYRNGASTGIAIAGISGIRVWARGGNDTIDIDGIQVNSYLHGGAGDDTIVGGSALDLIFGGLGADHLTGGGGHDLLMGGSGSDRIVGSAGNDVLVAGEFACSTSRVDLEELLDSWSNQVESNVEEAADEVYSDDEFDMLTGSSGADWFIVGSGDKITDLKKRNTDGDRVTTA